MHGKGLTGRLAGLWCYRAAGDWRVICAIGDDQMVILAVDAGHRSSIYDYLSAQHETCWSTLSRPVIGD